MLSFHSCCNEQVILKKWLKACDFDVQQELFPPLQNDVCSPANVSESDIKEFLTSIPEDCQSNLEDISHSSLSFKTSYENRPICFNCLEFGDELTSSSKSECSCSSTNSVATNFTSFFSTNFEIEHTQRPEYHPYGMENLKEIDPLATSNHIGESTRYCSEIKARKSFPVKHKRRRKRFKPDQQKLLNSIFLHNQYFSSNKSDLARLASAFGVPQKTVRIWFQNKRTYWRKKNFNLGFLESSLHNKQSL